MIKKIGLLTGDKITSNKLLLWNSYYFIFVVVETLWTLPSSSHELFWANDSKKEGRKGEKGGKEKGKNLGQTSSCKWNLCVHFISALRAWEMQCQCKPEGGREPRKSAGPSLEPWELGHRMWHRAQVLSNCLISEHTSQKQNSLTVGLSSHKRNPCRLIIYLSCVLICPQRTCRYERGRIWQSNTRILFKVTVKQYAN